MPGLEDIYAAGDAIDFPIKHGGLAAQQADVAAQAIAAQAGASLTPEMFDPVIHGMLLTYGKPRYLTAQISGGHGFSSEISDTPTWSPPGKIVARYLAPYLDGLDRERVRSDTTLTSERLTTDHADAQPAITASAVSA